MEPKFQTAFIPKRPIVVGQPTVATHSTNIFTVIATIVFVVTLLVSGGMFVYKQVLNGQIAQADKDLVDARTAFEPQTIQNLIDISSRISSAQTLLQKHVVVSQLFTLLSQLTIKNVRFTNLDYKNVNNTIIVSMDGEASSYDDLASQSAQFAQSSYIQNQDFSTFDLADNGNVKFKFTGSIDPALVSYKKAVEAMSTSDTSTQQ